MKLINQNAELLIQQDWKKQIEIAARTCYSEDTEVLTNSGWKLFSEVSNEDRVLTYVPETNEMVWDIPNVICREIEDSMIEIDHANIKLCVTKDHRIYQSVPEKREYSFITASQLAGIDKIPKSKQCRFRIPKYFINSKRSPDCIHTPTIEYETIVNIGHGRVTRKSIKLEITKDFMVIAGAFIAEGHTNNHSDNGSGSNCQITQAEGTPLYNNVIQALNNLGWSYRIDKDPRKPEIKWIIINGGILWVELFDYLFGKGSTNKHLPPWFRQLPDEYLEIMLENMYLGDGSHTTTRKERYLSISQRLLEEIQEVFILLGKNASFTYDTNINQKCSLEESTRDSWIISRNKHIKILPSERRKVYCTSTNSGIIQIRYKGKTCWCGNCYKSEDKIAEGTADKMVEMLIKRKHYAMLEHGTIYMHLRKSDMEFPNKIHNLVMKYRNNPYSRTKIDLNSDNAYITTNYRVIKEHGWEDDLEYLCEPTDNHVKRYTFRLTTSISIVRELLRHRVFSFANESTRYIDYRKKGEIVFIKPTWYNEKLPAHKEAFSALGEVVETYYNGLRMIGEPAQFAREVLPLCTKSELIMTGFEDDWNNFLDVRLRGTTGKPHPDMIELAEKINSALCAYVLVNSKPIQILLRNEEKKQKSQ